MEASAYTYTALAMRYFFIAAILFILLQLVMQSIGEYREMRRAKRQVAGTYLRYIVFTDPIELRGLRYALLKENTIGRSKGNSIQLQYRGVRLRQGNIYQSGDSMWFSTHGKRGVYHNDAPLKHHHVELQSGDMIELHGVRFQYFFRSGAQEAAHE